MIFSLRVVSTITLLLSVEQNKNENWNTKHGTKNKTKTTTKGTGRDMIHRKSSMAYASISILTNISTRFLLQSLCVCVLCVLCVCVFNNTLCKLFW